MEHTIVLFFLSALAAGAGEFYIDAERGDPVNDGSAERPWRSLQETLDRGLVESRGWPALPHREGQDLVPRNPGAAIRGGDTLWLSSGDYGELVVDGFYNTAPITVAAREGQRPRFAKILVRSSSCWVFRGLGISPDAGGERKAYTLFGIESHGWRGPVHDIAVESCVLSSAEDTSAWTREDWNARACNGILADGDRIVIRGNRLKNVDFGISAAGPRALVENNVVENFSGDGLRGLGDFSVFQSNTVKNCYAVNANHDDGFQSWSVGPKGVGSGVVKGVVLRGNRIVNYEDPNQPHRGTLQGIGCFDGIFEDWVIENNVIVVDHWHGITLGGARGCRIVNNTVIDPNDEEPGPAWIRIGKHKDGTPSANCVVRNNLASSIQVDPGEGMEEDHNVLVADKAATFVDAGAFDLRLKPGSPAIDAGTGALAPVRDAQGVHRPQGRAVDAGAYEHTPD
jgi:hypothetical protein